ncbi:MAG TPA: efflux RND transporter periplasmic adaptor subunit [Isosphaeraceae bacterium]|nr:efflux RND transporter periplasmic adaptor subunit [Isosphaeraceae bacterium]
MAEASIMEVASADRPQAAPPKPTQGPILARFRWLLVAALLVAIGGGGALYWSRRGQGKSNRDVPAAQKPPQERSHAQTVEVIHPARGGMARIVDMPGTIRAKEFALLYAKVSGYLKELTVDRGDRVKKGQVLAQIYVPELDVAVLRAQASLQHAQAMAHQAEARIKTAEAGVKAAEAKQKEAASKLEEAVARRTYRKKALDRITELASRNAVEPRLVDEDEDQYMASIASEHAAQSGILTADARLVEAKAAVDLAEADLVTAKAEIAIADATLKNAQVMQGYTRIEAPFDGVITFRGEGVHRGAFIRSAADGISEPLLMVACNDCMRTIIEIPDKDVAYCNPGDPATVKVDAIKGRTFKGVVSRMADSEDLKNRTMRVEVDLPNPDGILRDGMWGRGIIEVEPPSKNLTIPSTCLIEQNGKSEGTVFAVRDGKVKKLRVRVGKDNGVRVEILSGLTESDVLVAQITPAITEGLEVKPKFEPTAAAEKTASAE